MEPRQIFHFYGPDSPYNSSDAIKRLYTKSRKKLLIGIQKDIKRTAETNSFDIRLKDLINSPQAFAPFINSPTTGDSIILSPLAFSPFIQSPSVLGPMVLSPWIFSPLIVSPHFVQALILSPHVFSPHILSPLFMQPNVFSPGVFSAFVLSPFVLSPSVKIFLILFKKLL